MKVKLLGFLAVVVVIFVAYFTWSLLLEKQNRTSRYIQSITGLNGTLEVYAGNQLVRRFLGIEKLSTAVATESTLNRPYRYGYGALDKNLNGVIDENEKEVYFEFSDYSTNYIFFDNK